MKLETEKILLLPSKKNVMRHKLLLYAFLLSLAGTPLAGSAQDPGQRDLLQRAYHTNSYVLLEQFFDNWQKEYADNEAEAPDKWVAEAHKVFAAMLRPDISSEIGIEVLGPVLVVQSTLDKIGYVNKKSMAFQKGDLDKTVYVTVDSAIDFRPKYQIEGLTTVYLTEGYKTIVNDYLTTFMLPPLEIETFDDWEMTETDSIWNITGNEKEPYDLEEAKLQEELERIFFLRDYAGSILCHYFLASVITPFFSIDKIIFDRSFQYAVVEYHQCKRGGTIVLKKVKNKWTFDHLYEWWVSS
ncbi:MAG: hypothetical protein IKO09_06890 [Bacteroidales bacterium]|nr:hypothetical protein [Bacteroidales bacterium]